MMRNYIKYLFQLFVLICFASAHAGATKTSSGLSKTTTHAP